MHASQDDQGAHLEPSREPIKLGAQLGTGFVIRAERLQGNQQLGGDLVTPTLHRLCRDCGRLSVRERGLTEPDVRKLMSQREHLRCLAVRAVDEHQRGKVVRQREAAELLGIELAPGVTADHTAHHDQNAEPIGLLNEASQRLRPGWELSARVEIKAQRFADDPGGTNNVVPGTDRPDESQPIITGGSGEIAVPVLPLLAQIDGIQEIRTGLADVGISDRSEIGDGNGLFRRLREKQKPNRRMRCLRETLELFERRLCVAALPLFKLGETFVEVGKIEPRAISRSAQQLLLHHHAIHFHTNLPSKRPKAAKSRSRLGQANRAVEMSQCSVTKHVRVAL